MRTGQNGEPDNVDVFLNRSAHDLLRRLAETGIDHFHPGVAQRAGDDFDAAVMSVKPRLGEKHSYPLLIHL